MRTKPTKKKNYKTKMVCIRGRDVSSWYAAGVSPGCICLVPRQIQNSIAAISILQLIFNQRTTISTSILATVFLKLESVPLLMIYTLGAPTVNCRLTVKQLLFPLDFRRNSRDNTLNIIVIHHGCPNLRYTLVNKFQFI